MTITGRRWSFTPTVISGAPETSGVFALFEGERLVYYGSTVPGGTLRSALSQHLRRAQMDDAPTHDVTHYSWEIVSLPELRELELLREFYERHGRVPRCNQLMRENQPLGSDVAARRRAPE
jgi:hypothetical protein